MKIFVTNHSVFPYADFRYGGTEKRVYFLAKYLRRNGVDAEIVSSIPRNGSRKEIYEGIPYNFIGPHFTPSTAYPGLDSRGIIPMVNLARFSANLSLFLRKQTFDVLHAHLTDPYFYLRLDSRRPTVFQPWEEIHIPVRDILNEKPPSGVRAFAFRSLKGHVDQFCMEHAEAVASESEAQTRVFIERFKIEREKVFHLPVGVDMEYILNRTTSVNLTREDLGLREKDFVLISANRLDRAKGLNFLIDAMYLLKNEIRDVKLVLIGTGPEEEALKSQANERGLDSNIKFVGNIPESKYYQVLSLSDVYVSPGFQYISTTTILDAMACGLAVVSTIPSFNVKDKVNGYVVPKKSARAIADAIIKIYDSGESEQFGRRSFEMARRYDYKILVNNAIHKYEELIKK